MYDHDGDLEPNDAGDRMPAWHFLFMLISVPAYAVTLLCCHLSQAVPTTVVFNYFVWAALLFYTVGTFTHTVVPVYLDDVYFARPGNRWKKALYFILPVAVLVWGVGLIVAGRSAALA